MESSINEHTHSINDSDSFSRFYLRTNDSRFTSSIPSMIRLQSNNPDLQFSNNINSSKEIIPIINEISDLI